jgi:selenocysteine-specific elongation factor
VIDIEPPRGVARRRMTPERLAALAMAADVDVSWAARLDLHGAIADGGVRLAADVATSLRTTILSEVGGAPAGRRLADLRSIAATDLRRNVQLSQGHAREAAAGTIDGLVADGALDRDGDTVRRPGHAPSGPSPALLAAMDRLVAILEVLAPPPLAEAARATDCPPEGIRALESGGRILRLDDDLAYGAGTYAALEERATMLATAGPLTPAAFRDATGTSRKYVMAILEDLDRRGVLRRTPDGHVPGPRAAAAGTGVHR